MTTTALLTAAEVRCWLCNLSFVLVKGQPLRALCNACIPIREAQHTELGKAAYAAARDPKVRRGGTGRRKGAQS